MIAISLGASVHDLTSQVKQYSMQYASSQYLVNSLQCETCECIYLRIQPGHLIRSSMDSKHRS